jgi:hypothetical protein
VQEVEFINFKFTKNQHDALEKARKQSAMVIRFSKDFLEDAFLDLALNENNKQESYYKNQSN